MALRIKPKSFGPVFVMFDDKGTLQYAYSDLSQAGPYPPANSPVDTLIASLGSCIAKSLEWVANQRKITLHPFTVKLVGTKSTDLPGRLEKVDITIYGKLIDDATQTLDVVKQAKSICTVSNSLTTEVDITVEPEFPT